MREIYRKIYQVLDPHERRRSVLLLGLFLVRGFTEMVGVASVIPFMAVASNPDIIESNQYLAMVYLWLGFESHDSFLIFLGIVMFFLVVGSQLFGAFTEWFLHRFNQMCDYRMSVRLLGNYYARPYSWFLNRHSADLGRTVVSEVQHMVAHAILPATRLLSRLFLVMFLLGLVIAANPTIAMTAVTTLGGSYVLIYFTVRRHLVRLGRVAWQTNEERYRASQEGLAGIKDVKVSGLEAAYLARYRTPALLYARNHANQRIIGMVPKYLLEAIAFGGILAIVVVLLTVQAEGLGTALPLIAVYAFAGYRLMPSMQMIYHDLTKMKFGTRSLDRIHDELVTSKQAEIPKDSSADNVQGPSLPLREKLELVELGFNYEGAERRALADVSLVIRANTTVGFVGATGAGKTTIVDIILGLLEPQEGQVLVDGAAITGSNRRAWQRSLGYVPQQIFLVDDSVAANIAFGQKAAEIDMDAVEHAARAAELHEFVATQLPDGYQTRVGERGVRLSGGQRQRIGIARALYRDPSVLVLDEATSALDNITEQAVMSAVHNLGGSKTVIMIAHRLSTVRNCDTIFLLEQGRLVDSGTYEELSERSDRFRAMAQAAAS
ncbi:ABC transporter ATP-binding protein [Thioalkalivibrio sp. XN279]|uniref:ABC transporter ATP-binding protein n=1 Tax=Thioalkalivibrio sp. XN279 TaxID=2714953 RepID=UPI001407FCD8|nr:ABC transporter ATP-binding protein [Thioalkalivibrio sp. XN279]NHA15379.1 ABC transporter ATP-binding protein [Thioalkalivibrio sp. XN279]